MAVKVLISRQFKKDKIDQAFQLLMELRSTVTLQPGYIFGQTLVGADDPNKVLVIGTWTARKRWEDWKGSEKRKDFSERLEPFLEGPEVVDIYLSGEEASP
jgi:quinol monooxygenase YgiN